MRRMSIVSFVLLFTAPMMAPALPFKQENVKIKVENKVPLNAYPFDLQDVRLLDGPFHDACRRDQKYLLDLDSDRLLHNFRVTAGLPSAAKPYGGWEAPDVELRGHSVGHFLSACALMYASAGDERLKAKAEAMVVELAKIQQALAVRGGSIIPLGPVKQYTSEKVDGPLTLLVYPGADTTFTHYEDDGATFNYRRGEWMKIQMAWDDGRRRLRLRLADGSRMRPPLRRHIEVRVASEKATRTIIFEGRPVEVQC